MLNTITSSTKGVCNLRNDDVNEHGCAEIRLFEKLA